MNSFDIVVTFLSPTEEKNVTISQNIEVADAKGSHITMDSSD